MAKVDIIQNMITMLGQSRQSRLAKELDAHFADIEERDRTDLLKLAAKFAELVNFYDDEPTAPVADWKKFFDVKGLETLPASADADVLPHLALFIAFLELYEKPKEVLNAITGRHLDLYYNDVLRFEKKKPLPNKAHLLVELKKNVPPVELGPEILFSGGKGPDGAEFLYSPTVGTVINAARIESLRSVFVDSGGGGIVRFAPLANSVDGKGGAFDGQPEWSLFGSKKLPEAKIGFALTHPVLRMKEGLRHVEVILTVENGEKLKEKSSIVEAFEVSITGEKGWISAKTVSASWKEASPSPAAVPRQTLTLKIDFDPSEKPVIDYDRAVHQFAFDVAAPVLSILLKPEKEIGYNDLSGVAVVDAEVAITVSDIRSLQLENDLGAIDPNKPFLPFGPQPLAGSRFTVVSAEAAEKGATGLTLKVTWQVVPDSTKHYIVGNNPFTVTIAVKNLSGVEIEKKTAQPLFGTNPKDFPLQSAGAATFILETHFFHSDYRKKYAEEMARYVAKLQENTGAASTLPNEPYTPVIAEIKATYNASSSTSSGLLFFHVGCFGEMIDNTLFDPQLAASGGKRVSLLPQYGAGELFMGLSNLDAGDSVSVLFQAAEGSNDPDLKAKPVAWSVLCGNSWSSLGNTEVLLDSTNNFLTSGTIRFVVPPEATKSKTFLPPGLLWVRGTAAEDPGAFCRMVDVAANAVEVKLREEGRDPSALPAVLPAGTVAKLKSQVSSVKSVKQPYASFGGFPGESDDLFHARVAERLRHKNRCITPWDYERIVLEAFREVHKVKCIPHAKDGSWLAPGNVLIVTVADLANKSAADPLQPKVDTDTLSRIETFLRARTGHQVGIAAKNPTFQQILLDFKVRFKEGYEFNYYSNELNEALKRFLSPWAYGGESDISFGGKMYKSVLVDFVEELPYVDFVTDFRMYSFRSDRSSLDLNEAQPETPDAILVSAGRHIINPVQE